MWPSKNLTDSILTAVVFGVTYWVSFEISKHYDLTQSFAPGVSLIFIPAGVKLLAALVGGLWGVMGVVLALIYLANDFWAGQSQLFIFLTATINGLSTLAVVEAMRRLLTIDDDLSNLRLLHLPLIDLANSVCHGLVHNAFWIFWGVEKPSDFLSHATAMTVGDFFGSLIVLLGLSLVLKLKNKFNLTD